MATVTVEDKSNKKAGTNTSASYKCPDALTKNASFEFHALVDSSDVTDPTFRMSLHVDVSDDGVEWRYFGGIEYVGYLGTVQNPQGIPGFGVHDGSVLKSKYIRFRYKTDRNANLGARVKF